MDLHECEHCYSQRYSKFYSDSTAKASANLKCRSQCEYAAADIAVEDSKCLFDGRYVGQQAGDNSSRSIASQSNCRQYVRRQSTQCAVGSDACAERASEHFHYESQCEGDNYKAIDVKHTNYYHESESTIAKIADDSIDSILWWNSNGQITSYIVSSVG